MSTRREPPNPRRNGPCPCGSGKKFKKCHLLIDREEARVALENWKVALEERRRAVQARRAAVTGGSEPTRSRSLSAFLGATLAMSALSSQPESRKI